MASGESYQFSLRTLLAVVALSAVLLALLLALREPRDLSAPSIPDPSKQIKDVEIALMGLPQKPRVFLHITDPTLIQSLIVEPLSQAHSTHRSSEVFLAKMTLLYTDGNTDVADLFLPWGRLASKGRPWKTDLSGLQSECRKMLITSTSPEAQAILNDPLVWQRQRK